LNLFHVKDADIRDKNIFDITSSVDEIDKEKLNKLLTKTKNTTKMQSLTTHFDRLNKYFNIEFSSLNNNKSFLGTLILFKDITQHMEDMKTIKDNQDSLMESERLASLGQLIGGIAHNLKTPIMSISGAAEGLTDLVKEYDMSIENPSVNFDDHHAIAKDMSVWIEKIKDYTEYMSDIITAVKGQAVTLSETENVSFDLEELVKRIDILMKHELKNAIIYLNVHMFVDSKIVIHGDVNSLVQVINNMISNAIQAYNGKTEEEINLDFNLDDSNNLIISIEDHADGLPQKVKDKLFKEMITTKGKNGTGLGLYMSYSTIKAHFNGNITFESEAGKGTKFNIILPL
jgi:C4-dicarboxylate-specific signal transduction histidine kinase